MRAYGFIVVILLVTASIFSPGCRKDMLHFNKVVKLNSNTSSRLNNIRFLDNNVCIAAGGETFYRSVMCRSVDGGYTWTTDSSTDAPKELYGMGVAPDGGVSLSGIDGCLLTSRDKGSTWRFCRIGNWLVYKGGTFPVPDTGVFVSTVLQRDAAITRIDSSCNVIDSKEFGFGINNIYMLGGRTGYVIGYGAMMRTKDMGNTWEYLKIDGDNFTCLASYGSHMWVCGANGSVFYSADNGDNWQRQRNGNDLAVRKYLLRTIAFTDTQHGWAAGDYGTVIYTRDGGAHWSEYDSFTSSTIRSIAVCPGGDLLFAGDDGIIFRVTP